MTGTGQKWAVTFDCSTPAATICVGWIDAEAGTSSLVASDTTDDQPNQTSAQLVPRIERLLTSVGRQPGALSFVGVGCGPGMFTGSRVALATAKGLALGLGAPLVPVSTLCSVALSCRTDGIVLATLDARRDEIYGARFSCSKTDSDVPRAEPIGEPRCAPLAEFMAELEHDAIVAGPGAAAYPEAVPAHHRCLPGGLTAAGLWSATCGAFVEGAQQDPAAIDVTYLRKSYAELGINRPKRPFVRSPFV